MNEAGRAAADAWRKDRRWLLAILIATCLAYISVLGNDWTYDGKSYARGYSQDGAPNYLVEELRPLGDYFSKPMGWGSSSEGRSFRPITVLSYAVMWNWFKGDVKPADPRQSQTPSWPSHLLNLLLHLCGSFVVYLLVVEIAGRGPPALIAAAVFGLHALRSDPLLSVVGRAEIMACLFGMLGSWLLVRGYERRDGKRWSLLLGAALSFFLCYGSKESAMAWFPFAICFFWARAATQSEDPWRPTLRAVPTWLMVAGVPLLIFVVMMLQVWAGLDSEFEVPYRQNPLWHADGATRFATGVMMLGYGLYKVMAPFSLACDYGAEVLPIVSLGSPLFWVSFLALSAVLVLGLWFARRGPLLLLSIAGFFGLAFITSNTFVPVEAIFAERFYYSPALGLSFLLAFVATRLRGRGPLVTAGVALLAVWLAANFYVCHERTSAWQDNGTLMATDVESQPDSLAIQFMLSGLARRDGDPQKQYYHLQQALRIDPESPEPLNMLGSYHYSAEPPDYVKAAEYFERALRSPRPRPDSLDFGFCMNLAMTYARLGQPDKQMDTLTRALQIQPDSPDTLFQLMVLATAQKDMGRMAKLIAHRREHQSGPSPQLDFCEGLYYQRAGHHAQAVALLQRSLPQLEAHANWSDPTFLEGQRAVILSLKEIDQRSKARAWLQRLLADPRFPAAQRQPFLRLQRDL